MFYASEKKRDGLVNKGSTYGVVRGVERRIGKFTFFGQNMLDEFGSLTADFRSLGPTVEINSCTWSMH